METERHMMKRNREMKQLGRLWSVASCACTALLGLALLACDSESSPQDMGVAGSGGFPPGMNGGGGAANAGGAGGGAAPVAGNGGANVGGDAAGGGNGGGSPLGGAGGATPNGGEGGDPGLPQEEYPVPADLPNEDGADLWLRYPQLPIPGRLAEYQAALTNVVITDTSETLQVAQEELIDGISGLTGMAIVSADAAGAGSIVVGTAEAPALAAYSERLSSLGPEGFIVEATEIDAQSVVVVAANTDVGALYGSYALLRHLQSHRALSTLALQQAPKIQHRVLNHWDNLNGSVERGYAGSSLWNWGQLPGTLSGRYRDYARANASIGINGTVLTNVNADAQVLTAQYLDKVAALADEFRPFGIRVYLTARFSAPIEIGGLNTADPNNSSVAQWWAGKADEIYQRIPDFGGFLVKANSEGQPGPGDYGRSHAEGANMLADAVAPHGGIVMWRAFVYSEDSPADRIRQAYDEFKPLDGSFRDNVLVQAKNGPLDFQPREPFHPLFGAMPQTPLTLELQITKEYLGQDTHLAYLGPWYEEVLQADTYAAGAGSTVARVIDGSLHNYSTTAIAGVANIGSDTNWSGSHFNQANWYVFGRMAWDPDLTSAAVADEWVRLTLSNDPAVVGPVTELMMASHQALVDYMTPLGLVHIMGSDHHYGPAPWVSNLGRPEWNPVYYHKADAQGIGFDRTSSGSNAVAQYASEVGSAFASRDTVPDAFLLFFHRVGWQETLASGRTLWEELVHRYSVGVDQVGVMRDLWQSVQGRVDAERFGDIDEFLQIQHWEARWWRDACLQYFGSFANLQVPAGYAQPNESLSYYQGLNCPPNRDKPRCQQINSGEPSPAVTQ